MRLWVQNVPSLGHLPWPLVGNTITQIRQMKGFPKGVGRVQGKSVILDAWEAEMGGLPSKDCQTKVRDPISTNGWVQ
jgi:hypothetical protein